MTSEMELVLLTLKIYLFGFVFSIFFLMGEVNEEVLEKDSTLFIFLIKVLFWFITIPYKIGKLFYKLNKYLEANHDKSSSTSG
jgi:hypothetical protein